MYTSKIHRSIIDLCLSFGIFIVNVLAAPFVARSKRLNVKNNRRGPCFLNTFSRKKDPISDILPLNCLPVDRWEHLFQWLMAPFCTECHLNFSQKRSLKKKKKKSVQYPVLCFIFVSFFFWFQISFILRTSINPSFVWFLGSPKVLFDRLSLIYYYNCKMILNFRNTYLLKCQ